MIYSIVNLRDVTVDDTKPVFCDTETCGLYGKVRLFQCYQEGWDKVALVEWPSKFELAVFIKAYHTVWHNAHYDLTTIYGGLVPDDFDDTFLLSRLACPSEEAYSLDAIMTKAIGYDPYERANLDKKVLQKSPWAKATLSADQLEYAAIDVLYMPEVWELVKDARTTQSYELDILSLRAALEFQLNGLPVDSERLDAEYTRISNELVKIPMPINANSWQQVRKWLDVDQSDKQFLSNLALHGNDKARAVLDVRTRRKLISFLEKYDKERVIGKFKPSARSGRFTSDDDNLQQIPRALKCIFGYPKGSDRTLIYADYAQLELRTICAILGVKLMETMFRDGVDLHGYVASVLFGENYEKSDRQVTKTYNFNLLYGGSVNMVLSILITYGLLIEQRDAERHKKKWLRLFPEIASWQQQQISNWRRGELGSTPLGRQYKGNLMTDQMNIMNQGAGAEVAKLALRYIHAELPIFNTKYNVDVKIVNFVHDSYILDAPNDPEIYEEASKLLAKCMQRAWFQMSRLYKVKDLPMPVEVMVGNNWGDIENGTYDFKHELEGMTYAEV